MIRNLKNGRPPRYVSAGTTIVHTPYFQDTVILHAHAYGYPRTRHRHGHGEYWRHPMGYPHAHTPSRDVYSRSILRTVDESMTDVEQTNEGSHSQYSASELRTRNMYTANSEQRTANSARRLESTRSSICKQQQASSRYPDPLCGGGGGGSARVLTLLPVSPPSFPEA